MGEFCEGNDGDGDGGSSGGGDSRNVEDYDNDKDEGMKNIEKSENAVHVFRIYVEK